MKNSTAQSRKKIFLIVTGLIVLLIVFKFADIMLFSDTSREDSSFAKSTVERGPILDRNGRILAIQTKLHSVTAWIPSIKNVEKTADIISQALGIDKNQLMRDMTSRSRFMYIKRKISNTEADRLREYIDRGDLPGIGLEPEYGRSYPEKDMASHLIGYTGTDNVGLDGIEYTYNSVLSPPASQFGSKREIYGSQVFLTVDSNIQNFAHQAALDAYEKYDPDSVILIAAEARTGHILAYVSMPEIDLNNFSLAPEKNLPNLPVAAPYEPGSVFKVFSIAALLQIGGIDEESTFFCNGFFESNLDSSNPIRIRCLGNHGHVDAQKILKFSCNSGAAYASLTASDETFYQMLKMFDFGEQTKIPLPGESRGLFRDYRLWSARSKPTIAFGQELSVSAMQVVKAATTLANDGVMLQPQVVSRIIGHDGKTIIRNSREPVRQVLSPEVARSVLEMMVTVTDPDGGTGRRAAVDGIRMAVKTGTSQTIDRVTGTYSDKAFISSCLAVFPAEDPQIIIYNVIDNPKRVSYFGGVIAAPVVGDVSDKIVSYLGIPRRGDTVIDHSGSIVVTPPEQVTLDNYVPDFSGLSKIQLLPLLKEGRIKVLITGEGWVRRQSPAPGTEITDGMTIKLELE